MCRLFVIYTLNIYFVNIALCLWWEYIHHIGSLASDISKAPDIVGAFCFMIFHTTEPDLIAL